MFASGEATVTADETAIAAATKPAANPEPAAPARPPADRSKLDAAEKALGELDERRRREEADFRKEEEVLEARRAAAQSAYVDARKAPTAEAVGARTSHREAWGES